MHPTGMFILKKYFFGFCYVFVLLLAASKWGQKNRLKRAKDPEMYILFGLSVSEIFSFNLIHLLWLVNWCAKCWFFFKVVLLFLLESWNFLSLFEGMYCIRECFKGVKVGGFTSNLHVSDQSIKLYVFNTIFSAIFFYNTWQCFMNCLTCNYASVMG